MKTTTDDLTIEDRELVEVILKVLREHGPMDDAALWIAVQEEEQAMMERALDGLIASGVVETEGPEGPEQLLWLRGTWTEEDSRQFFEMLFEMLDELASEGVLEVRYLD